MTESLTIRVNEWIRVKDQCYDGSEQKPSTPETMRRIGLKEAGLARTTTLGKAKRNVVGQVTAINQWADDTYVTFRVRSRETEIALLGSCEVVERPKWADIGGDNQEV